MTFSMLGYLLFSVSFFPFGIALGISLFMLVLSRACRLANIRPSAWLQHYLPNVYQHLKQRLSIDNIAAYQVLILLLVNFGLVGYFLQLVCYSISGHYVNPVLLIAPAFILSHLLSAALIHWFKQLNLQRYTLPDIPGENHSLLLGRIASINKGNAKPGASAEAMVRDHYGHLHFIQVEPEYGELREGSEVILFGHKENFYLAKLLPPDDQLMREGKRGISQRFSPHNNRHMRHL